MMRLKEGLQKIAIFGAGGFGMEVAMLVEHINAVTPTWDLLGFFDEGEPKGKIVNGYSVLGGISELNEWETRLSVVLALGLPKTKKQVLEKIRNDRIPYPVLIHPSVIMGKRDYLTIGEGTIICAGTILTTNIRIGRHVLLNLSCTVGHQTEIGDFCSFMPTCNISGEVRIGEGNFWGTGAKIINRKRVGNNVTVGAGAVIVNDVPDNVTVIGVPARVIKRLDSQKG
jgi:sugar O-acyltransferase (sialic acid O-acetyltransferase NeuD family)